MGKGDRITACLIGRDIPNLTDGFPRPDFEESSIQVIFEPNDHRLNEVIKQWNPNVFVTFGNARGCQFLCSAPFEVRRKWIDVPPNAQDKDVGQAVFNCYRNSVFSDGNPPLISVFTPVYRPGAKLFRPLQSLLDQTWSNWEWVLVDDSDDNGETWGLLRQISEMDHRIRPFLPCRHSGRIGELKREACGLAKGEILAELDHDDELTNQCLEWVVEGFKSNPGAGMVYTDNAEVFEDTLESFEYGPGFGLGYGSYRKEAYKGRVYSVANDIPLNGRTIRHIVGVPNHIRAWRRETYFKIGGHNPDLHVADDYELICRTFLHATIVHLPRFGYIQYRNRSGNTTFSRNGEIQRMVRMIQESYESQLETRCRELGV